MLDIRRSKARIKASLAYFRRSLVVESGPIELIVDATNRCNQSCVMCRREYAGPPWADIPPHVVRWILQDVGRDLSLLDFSQRGEPLLHRDLTAMVQEAARAGVPTYVATNATVLDEDRSRALIAAGLTLITFSLDAASPEVYRRIHGGRFSLEEVERNVLSFLRLRRTRPPYVMVQMVRLDDNVAEVAAFWRRWTGLVDRVRVKRKNDRAGLYAGPGSDDDSRAPVRTPCPRLWRGLAVLSDGRVVPCCYDVTGREMLGRVPDDAISVLWNGERMRALRERHLAGRRHEIDLCRGCGFPEYPILEGLAFSLVAPIPARLLAGTVERWLQRP